MSLSNDAVKSAIVRLEGQARLPIHTSMAAERSGIAVQTEKSCMSAKRPSSAVQK